VSFWACAQLQPNRTRLARLLLEQRGFEVYAPQVREKRHRVNWLFPGYLFITIELQWHDARWCPGLVRLVMDGMTPAKVPDSVIAAIRERERNGLAAQAGRSGADPALSPAIWRSTPARRPMSGCWCCWRCWIDLAADQRRTGIVLNARSRARTLVWTDFGLF
jgi:Transcription termination factor nusG